MNCTDDEEGFKTSHITQEILSLLARDVLRYPKVRDPLSLRLNMVGALRNWKDVADLLGYRVEEILGLFAHDARPGLKLLEDWIYEKNGLLGRLVDVFTELKLYNCLDVVFECVAEYEEASLIKIKELGEDDDDDDSDADVRGNHKRKHEQDIDISLSSNGSPTMGTSTDYSTESPISSPSTLHSVATDSASFSSDINNLSSVKGDCSRESEEKCLSYDNTEHEAAATVQKPQFLRYNSWSPGCHEQADHLQDIDGGRNSFNRSVSHPADMKSKVGAENKKKSFKKKIARLFKGKQHKKSPVQSSHTANSCTLASTADSTATSFTVTGSYSESAQKPCENLSPLKVDEARRLSETDSLSSGESVSLPTSPGYESGYFSSEGPSVSSGTSISIIHCSDLEGESYQKEGIWKLYSQFSETLGYKCFLDKLEMLEIAQNKFRYAIRRVQHSDFLFICVSPELKRIFDSSVDEISEQLEDDGNCMLRLVSDLILNDLAIHGSNRKGKFMTIVLEGSSKRDVPCFLESFMKYSWPKDERKIRCIIEGQPEIVPARVSDVKTDPPSQVVRPAGLL